MNFLERFFKLKENGTTVSREIYTGLITFLAVSYILAVNPEILSSTGMDRGAVFYATAIAAFFGTQKLLFLLCCIAGLSTATAQGFPTISTDDVTKWYLIQFMNGGNAITAETANANITTAAATGSDAQLWKITGNASTGYTFTNKKGYTLYANSAVKDQMIRAAASATGVYRFKINSTTNGSYSGGYEIQPASNTGISMNLWGGPAENRGVGLWNSGDQNNPVTFVDATTFEELGKISIIPQPAELTVNEGKLAVSSLNAITFPSEEIEKYVSDFAAMLAKTSGTTLTVKESGSEAATGEIWLATDATLPAEGYTLNVSEKGIEIKAATKAGLTTSGF